jgi:hypothetical protein
MGSHDRNVCLGCRVSGRDRFDIKWMWQWPLTHWHPNQYSWLTAQDKYTCQV